MPCGAVRFSQCVQLRRGSGGQARAVGPSGFFATGLRGVFASNANSNDPDANSNTWPRFVPSANSDRFASKAGA